MASRSALFLDWGGTLALARNNRTVVDGHGRPVLMPNVTETLVRVRPQFDACFIASNQARIGRGDITEDEVIRRIRWLNEQLGGLFTDWRLCPHDDDDRCECRKPKGGMITELADLYGVDLASSTMVGDQEVDRQAGDAAGVGEFVFAKDFFGWK